MLRSPRDISGPGKDQMSPTPVSRPILLSLLSPFHPSHCRGRLMNNSADVLFKNSPLKPLLITRDAQAARAPHKDFLESNVGFPINLVN